MPFDASDSQQVFLSYRSRDGDLADHVGVTLDVAGCKVFLDTEARTERDVRPWLYGEVCDSAVMVLVAGAGGVPSKWVLEELAMAGRFAVPIIMLKVTGAAWVSDVADLHDCKIVPYNRLSQEHCLERLIAAVEEAAAGRAEVGEVNPGTKTIVASTAAAGGLNEVIDAIEQDLHQALFPQNHPTSPTSDEERTARISRALEARGGVVLVSLPQEVVAMRAHVPLRNKYPQLQFLDFGAGAAPVGRDEVE